MSVAITIEELRAWLEDLKAAGYIAGYEVIGRDEETGDLLYTVKAPPLLDRIELTAKGRAMVEKYMKELGG